MKKFYLGIIALLFAMFVLGACSSQNTTTEEQEETPQATEETGGATEEVANSENLFVYGDIVASKGCVLQNRFTKGDRIVFRMNVLDPLTSEQVEDATVKVHLSTGDELEMRVGPHPADKEGAPVFWTVGYTVPEDAPTGTLEYYVTAEKGEKSGEYRPFQVMPSLLTIVDAEPEASAQPEEEKAE